MNLKRAKVCLDCEEIFEGHDQCPKCGGTAWTYLSRWLNRSYERHSKAA